MTCCLKMSEYKGFSGLYFFAGNLLIQKKYRPEKTLNLDIFLGVSSFPSLFSKTITFLFSMNDC